VIVRCGDAYREALVDCKNSKAAKDLNGDGKIDYLDLGIARHDETLVALKLLGVAEDKVIFLGYPVSGLASPSQLTAIDCACCRHLQDANPCRPINIVARNAGKGSSAPRPSPSMKRRN